MTGPGEVTVHRASFAGDLLPVLDTKAGEVVTLPLTEVALDISRYRFTAGGAEGGLYECNYPASVPPGGRLAGKPAARA